MNFSKTASVLSFFGTLAIGISATYVANVPGEVATLFEPVVYLSPTAEAPLRVEAKDLVGQWKGSWGYDSGICTIEIDRVEGNKFYGILRMDGAMIALEGRLDSDTREIYFNETRVLKLHPELGEWSLGKNTGSFSISGENLNGTGKDKWGTYNWNVTKVGRSEIQE